MLKMKLKFFALFVLFVIGNVTAQQSKKNFPDDYLGIYKGSLSYETKNGLATIPMEFHLNATDSANTYDYWLVYNNQSRKYSIISKNKNRGTFQIDENNGIILPARFYENVLYSWFEVGTNKLTSRLQFEDDKIYFEILFSNLNNKTSTGGVSKDIPKVFGYPISSIQKAILIKED